MKSENERITSSLDSLEQFVKSANTLKDELTAAVHVLLTGFGQCTSGNSLGSTTKTLPITVKLFLLNINAISFCLESQKRNHCLRKSIPLMTFLNL